MINATELRIGNWVMFKILSDSYYIKVLGVTLDGEVQFTNRNGEEDIASDEYFSPIPLTPEILEKAGFAEDEYCLLRHPHLKCRWVSKNMSGINLDTPFLRFDAIGRLPFLSSDVYYLHELQNLYFALTGIELSVNIETSIHYE